MKKTTAILLSVLIIVLVICNAFASNVANRIYADTATVESGETLTIPVKIENNEGFMGFAVVVTYDADVFAPISVSKNSMLSGMFNDSIATSTNNSFKVVFTGTGNVTVDGELFNIVFDVADDVSGKYEIGLSYSQPDTFNENWDNVVFACEDIELIVTKNGTTATTTVTTTQPTTIIITESTTQKQETTTTQITTTEPSTTEPVTTEPSVEETTTQPATEPSTEPENDEKPLSVRMREWVNGLPFPLNIILGVFVIPVAFFVSLFE